MLTTEMGHFYITFENGYTLSAFNGFGSYTENNTNIEKFKEIMDTKNIYAGWTSKQVEIAILYNSKFVTKSVLNIDDDVTTLDINELIEVINKINNLERL